MARLRGLRVDQKRAAPVGRAGDHNSRRAHALDREIGIHVRAAVTERIAERGCENVSAWAREHQVHAARPLEAREERCVQRKPAAQEPDPPALVEDRRAGCEHRGRSVGQRLDRGAVRAAPGERAHFQRGGARRRRRSGVCDHGAAGIRDVQEVEPEQEAPLGKVLREIPAAGGVQQVEPLEGRILGEDPELPGDALAVAGESGLERCERSAQPLRGLRPHRALDPAGEEVHRERERHQRHDRDAEDEARAERVHGTHAPHSSRATISSGPSALM